METNQINVDGDDNPITDRMIAEGIDLSKVDVMQLCWNASAAPQPGARSALVRCDLILRDDGSAVFLDRSMGMDSLNLADKHRTGTANPENLPWDQWVQTVSMFPKS